MPGVSGLSQLHQGYWRKYELRSPSIDGPAIVCTGIPATLSVSGLTGVWSSTNAGVVGVVGYSSGGSSTGALSPGALGTATIRFSKPEYGCLLTKNVTVTGYASISGGTTVCTNTPLSANITGGTWSVASSYVTVDAGGTVFALTQGTATISYITPGGCLSTHPMTCVKPVITGEPQVCRNATTPYSALPSGGIWTATGAAIINPISGVASYISTGAAVIMYTVSSCSQVKMIASRIEPEIICHNQYNYTSGSYVWFTGPPSISSGHWLRVWGKPAGGNFNASSTYLTVTDEHDVSSMPCFGYFTSATRATLQPVASGTIDVHYVKDGCAATLNVGIE